MVEAGPGFAVERRQVVVVEVGGDFPAEAVRQRAAVLELAGHAVLLAGRHIRRDGRTEWIPPPNLDTGQDRINNYHHPERFLTPDEEDGSES